MNETSKLAQVLSGMRRYRLDFLGVSADGLGLDAGWLAMDQLSFTRDTKVHIYAEQPVLSPRENEHTIKMGANNWWDNQSPF